MDRPAELPGAVPAVGGEDGTLIEAIREVIAGDAPADTAAYVARLIETESGGRYRCGELLGRGSFGIVLAGQEVATGRRVAVKVLRPEYAEDRRLRVRFGREVRAAARLDHPAIVAVLDSGQTERATWLVSRRVDGPTLRGVLVRGPVPVDWAVSWMVQLAGAVGHAHDAGVLHRDVKPENVLIDEAGPKDRFGAAAALLNDFGLARLMDTDATLMSQTGWIIGSMRYMSPEQLSGAVGDHGPASDIYSLGVVFYEMLSGCNPFAKFNTVNQRVFNASRAVGDVRAVAAGVPASLSAICGRCLAVDPGDRYASAAALASDLEAFCGGRAISTPVRRRWRPIGKSKRRSMAIVATVLAGMIVAGRVVWREREPTQPASATTPAEYIDLAWRQGLREAFLANEAGNSGTSRGLLAELDRQWPDRRERIERRLLSIDLAGRTTVALQLNSPIREIRSVPGTRLIAAAAGDGDVHLVDVVSGQVIRRIDSEIESLHALAVSHDGKRIAVGGSTEGWLDRSYPRIFDRETGRRVAKLPGQLTTIESLTFTGDDAAVVCGCRYENAQILPLGGGPARAIPAARRHLWLDAADGQVAAQSAAATMWIGPADGVGAGQTHVLDSDFRLAAFVPGGDRILLAAYSPEQVEIYEPATRRVAGRLAGINKEVRSVAASPDGSAVWAGLSGGEIVRWEMPRSDQTEATMPMWTRVVGRGAVESMTWQAGRLVAATAEGELLIVNDHGPRGTAARPSASDPLTGAVALCGAWEPAAAEPTAWAGLHDGRVVRWTPSTGWATVGRSAPAPQADPTLGDGSVLAIDVLPGGRGSVAARHNRGVWLEQTDGSIELIPASAMAIDSAGSPAGKWNVVAVSPDGSVAAMTGDSRDVMIVDLQKRTRRVALRLAGCGTAIAWSPEGDRLAVADLSPQLTVLELKSGRTEVADITAASARLRWDRTGTEVFVGQNDGTVCRMLPGSRSVVSVNASSTAAIGDLMLLDDDRLGISLDVRGGAALWRTAERTPIGNVQLGETATRVDFDLTPRWWLGDPAAIFRLTSGVDRTVVVERFDWPPEA